MNSQSPNTGIGHYRSVGAYGAASANDRVQLIMSMMQGGLDRIATAKGHMTRQEVAEKGQAINGAIGLIDGLRACLDMEQGGKIASNLEALYDYMTRRLVEANLTDTTDILDEVADLLGEIKSGWEALTETTAAGLGEGP